ncbi:hypothetical protein NUW58_g8042 [Xylaria curta]|uniref:Uncharacterized protein n=1 Tax=Xylaria curta TaxID=42375 RepID=A0ACC1NBF8_9PEZI|nr:hypothetical protein NUW58_g8042 [Xylaria curta]
MDELEAKISARTASAAEADLAAGNGDAQAAVEAEEAARAAREAEEAAQAAREAEERAVQEADEIAAREAETQAAREADEKAAAAEEEELEALKVKSKKKKRFTKNDLWAEALKARGTSGIADVIIAAVDTKETSTAKSDSVAKKVSNQEEINFSTMFVLGGWDVSSARPSSVLLRTLSICWRS